jgi:hypothetical protein
MCWIAVLPRNKLDFFETDKRRSRQVTLDKAGGLNFANPVAADGRAGCSAVVAALAAASAAISDYQR